METGSKGVVRGRFNRALSSEREGGRHTRALGRGGNQRSWASPSPPTPRWPAGGGWPRPAWLLRVREGDAN